MTNVNHSKYAIQKHSKSFSLAALLLPPSAREPVRVLYAWCRRADDAVDEDKSGHPERRVRALRAELDAVYGGSEPKDPEARAFQQVVQRYAIPREYPEELIMGMQMDASSAQYTKLEELLLYCFRVAATVGLMMCHVLGVRNEKALRHAAHLGIAMQLTNICRDVKEDYARRRLYLPQALLENSGAGGLRAPNSGELPAPIPAALGPAVATTVERLLVLADEYYASADRGLKYLPLRSRIAVGAARHIYAAIGSVLERRSYDIFGPRAYVSRLKKGSLVLKAALSACWLGLRARSGRGTPAATPLPCIRYDSDLLTH